jgi:hypothetical protein
MYKVLAGAAGETVQEGTSSVLLAARSRDRRAGEHGVHHRVERGRVIEVARRAALCAIRGHAARMGRQREVHG